VDVDLGLLIVRLALGPMLVLHGWNKVFGGGGLEGTTRWFDGIGLRPAWLHARVAAFTEIAAGVAMTLGLLTGLVAAAFVGLMVVAARTDHRGKGYFVFKGGWEYVLLVAVVAVGLAAAGPGDWSLDGLLGLDVSGAWWAVAAAVLGVGAAAGLLATSYRPSASKT
jgi:putative oxidoreductase